MYVCSMCMCQMCICICICICICLYIPPVDVVGGNTIPYEGGARTGSYVLMYVYAMQGVAIQCDGMAWHGMVGYGMHVFYVMDVILCYVLINIHTHTYIYTYLYVNMFMCMCMYLLIAGLYSKNRGQVTSRAMELDTIFSTELIASCSLAMGFSTVMFVWRMVLGWPSHPKKRL